MILKTTLETTEETLRDYLEGKKTTDIVYLECSGCHQQIYRTKKSILDKIAKRKNTLSNRKSLLFYCTYRCSSTHSMRLKGKISTEVTCKECGVTLKRKSSEVAKVRNTFCSRSCSATYNNKNKTSGTRRSKLEIWLEQELTKLYPDEEIHYNRKDAINSELDIYFPALKLAIELNGIFHYEPIYGEDKLKQIKNNDRRKFQACLEEGIELCIVDVSSLSYFKKHKAKLFLDIILKIVDRKINSTLSDSN